MKLERPTLLITIAALALGAAGCAADRNKEVKSAEAELTNAKVEAQKEKARLADEQAKEKARSRMVTAEDRASLAAKQAAERADAEEEGTKEIAEAEVDVITAQAGMREERISTAAEAKARLQKADARFLEAHDKSANIVGKKRAKYDDNVHLYAQKRAEAESKIAALGRVSDDGWKAAKEEADKILDSLERFADRLNDDL